MSDEKENANAVAKTKNKIIRDLTQSKDNSMHVYLSVRQIKSRVNLIKNVKRGRLEEQQC